MPAQNPHEESVNKFLLLLALALRNIRRHSPDKGLDLALEVTDGIQNRIDAVSVPEHPWELAPEVVWNMKMMAEAVVSHVMAPELHETDQEDFHE